MAAAAKKMHYFVVNQLGQSADRRGPFESEEAALEWADAHYHYAAWVVPALPGKIAREAHRVLDKHGNPIQGD